MSINKYISHLQGNTKFLKLLFWILFCFSLPIHAQKQVTHLVLFKLKPGITKTDDRYKLALEKLKILPRKISDMKDCNMGENFSQRPIAYDFGLSVVFSSRKKLDQYLNHPEHLEVVTAWKEIADWHIVDFEDMEE